MPSQSLFMRLSTTLVAVASVLTPALAVPQGLGSRATTDIYYNLAKTFSGSDFFNDNDWSFYSGADPTHGYVTYVTKDVAKDMKLIGYDGESSIMRVDTTEKKTGPFNKEAYYNINGVGRKSVRIESKFRYTKGLILASINHMPSGICGTWPAFWTLGSGQWPLNGEIDIIEGANDQKGDWSSLHTGMEFTLDPAAQAQASLRAPGNCNLYANGRVEPLNYAGCTYEDSDASTYSNYKPGVWALQWTSDFIKVWYWPTSQVPSDVTLGKPVPGTSAWGKPRANMIPQNGKKVDDNFKDHQLIFDTTFCGDLGDATYGSCQAKDTKQRSCAQYVGEVPEAFTEARWEVKYVKVYTEGVAPATTTTTSTTSTSTTSTSTSSISSAATTTTTSSSSSTSATSSSSSSTASSTSMTSTSSTASSTSMTSTASTASSTSMTSTSSAASTTASATTTSAATTTATTTSTSASATGTSTTGTSTTGTSTTGTSTSATSTTSATPTSTGSSTSATATSTTATASATTTGTMTSSSTSSPTGYATQTGSSSTSTTLTGGITAYGTATTTATGTTMTTRPKCSRVTSMHAY